MQGVVFERRPLFFSLFTLPLLFVCLFSGLYATWKPLDAIVQRPFCLRTRVCLYLPVMQNDRFAPAVFEENVKSNVICHSV